MGTLAAVFSGIVALMKAVPIFESWVQSFITFYVTTELNAMRYENLNAIKKAINEKDQRDLEKLLGNPQAGDLSGIPGTEHRDSLPGVP